ncbi:MAG: hypothetical protein QNJ00_04170 [Woeseiaceae bacterium]|nr:hypothetical protein [Woeseiaceae bacterium]
MELPQNLILMTLGAFLIGWILSSINARLGSSSKTKKRDPKDDRIRSLEAELRIAQTNLGEVQEKAERFEKELEEATEGNEKRDNVITHQQGRVDELKRDLKESVRKTRELRSELSNRAEESVRSEARIREVETELSVAQASTDLIATGVLDYSVAPDGEEEIDETATAADLSKSASS